MSISTIAFDLFNIVCQIYVFTMLYNFSKGKTVTVNVPPYVIAFCAGSTFSGIINLTVSFIKNL